MKKILICIFLLLAPLSTQGFLGEDMWLNLYKNIDEGIDELENNTYIYEVVWDSDTIREEINRVLKLNNKRECISEDISIEEFNQIAGWDISLLTRKIWESCNTDDKNLSVQEINNIAQTIKSMAASWYIEAKKKVTNIYKTARVWLYTNGSINDSPFDLISDLEAIDEIIFWTTFEYDGRELDHWSLLKNRQADKISASKLSGPVWSNNIATSSSNTNTPEVNTESYLETPWENVCINPDLHWNLSSNSLKAIFWEKESTPLRQARKNTTSESYSSYNADDTWNCDDFFCVTVEYISYNHVALQSDKFSIKKIIDTSNEHLKKFTSASLLQSKMTKNFYELWLLVKDLPSMFNMWVMVVEKPVPIINVWDNTATDENTYGKTNLVEEYYKSKWLEYKRRNSVKDLQKVDAQSVAIINCAELPITCVSESIESYNYYMAQAERQSEALQSSIEQVWLYADNENFFRLFAELDGFIKWLYDYTKALHPLVKKIEKIPHVKN